MLCFVVPITILANRTTPAIVFGYLGHARRNFRDENSFFLLSLFFRRDISFLEINIRNFNSLYELSICLLEEFFRYVSYFYSFVSSLLLERVRINNFVDSSKMK